MAFDCSTELDERVVGSLVLHDEPPYTLGAIGR